LRAVEYTFFTNVTYGVFQFTLLDAPAAALRGGLGKINFQRLGGAVFTGTNFLHTNMYNVTYMTNRFGVPTLVTNEFREITDLPDILFGAADYDDDVGPSILERDINWSNNGDINSAPTVPFQGGPGNIFPQTTVTFNKVGPGLFNTRPGTATEEAAFSEFTDQPIWGSFDGSTNPPVVFPRDITLEDIELIINGGITP
jgi:hypothetical protein